MTWTNVSTTLFWRYGRPYGFVYGDGCESSTEDYTTPNGLTATIIKTIYPDGHAVYNAYFLIDGVAFNVFAREYSEPPVMEPEQVLEVLNAVLDGFILS